MKRQSATTKPHKLLPACCYIAVCGDARISWAKHRPRQSAVTSSELRPAVLCCVQAKYQMLVAASFLAEVVKVLERLTTHAAAAASAEPDEDMVSGADQHGPDECTRPSAALVCTCAYVSGRGVCCPRRPVADAREWGHARVK